MEARDVNEAELARVTREAGVPDQLTSCHTAQAGGFAVEGHVPAADLRRLLRERPQVAGIAVAGMPAGSPGMESGGRRDAYQVIAFSRDGKTSVFATYPAAR